MKLLHILIVFVYCVLRVYGLCYYPCHLQGRTFYKAIGPPGSSIFSCKTPSMVLGTDGEERECVSRAGPFTIQRRNKKEFRVYKERPIDPTGQVSIIYVSQWTKFHHNPGFCEVIAAAKHWTLEMSVLGEKPRKVKLPDLGCTVPMGCPVTNPYKDIPCTTCEPSADDGLCCPACQEKHKKYD